MKEKRSRRILLILVFLLGLIIFIYPTLSDYLARQTVTKGANTYERQITQLSKEVLEEMWEEARAYNDSLNGNPVPDPFIPGSGRVLPENYLSVLDMEEGIMGYIDIPKIKVYLPIGHGSAEEVLEKGAGHIEQTSLPIGGSGNLSVITAHTGFTGAEMFNRLVELQTGDIFLIHVLDETFTYEVNDIRVILPEEIESLLPVEGEDYVTLVTCTPYGVNSHRLLVRGTRIPNREEIMQVVEETQVSWKLVGTIVAVTLLFILIFIWNRRQGRKEEEREMAEAEIRRRELMKRIRGMLKNTKYIMGIVVTLFGFWFMVLVPCSVVSAETVARPEGLPIIDAETEFSIESSVPPISDAGRRWVTSGATGTGIVGNTVHHSTSLEVYGWEVSRVSAGYTYWMQTGVPHTIAYRHEVPPYRAAASLTMYLNTPTRPYVAEIIDPVTNETTQVYWYDPYMDAFMVYAGLETWLPERVTYQWMFGGTTVWGKPLLLVQQVGNHHYYKGPRIRISHAFTEIYPPVVITDPDVGFNVGDLCDWTQGITAQWGFTPERTIPDRGEITIISLNDVGTDPLLSTDGLTFDLIGATTHTYEIRDEHSLSESYPEDESVTVTSRKITVKTDANPNLQIVYHPTAKQSNQTSIPAGSRYDASDPLTWYGREEGWINQPLVLSVDPGSILGNFDTVLRIALEAPVVTTNGVAHVARYDSQSLTQTGTPVLGMLTEIGVVDNLLSNTIADTLKIDMTPPNIVSASYAGGFHFTDASFDALSGISLVSFPTQIAFAEPDTLVEPTSGWQDLDSHTMRTSGTYSVWIRATDKAGNEATARAHASLYVGGEVSIMKDTDKGAVLHAADCSNFASISIVGCGDTCVIGANPELESEAEFQYKLTLVNTAISGMAHGDFEDYLPEGVSVVNTPTASASGGAVISVTSALQASGRYLVSGSYSGLAPGETIDIMIRAKAPAYDDEVDANNVFSNQAETTWTIGSGMTQMDGTSLSNYANHQVRMEGAGVRTILTKVGADDTLTGIAGAEFALYRWSGILQPTQSELEHLVDSSVLTDAGWRRVTLHGADATSTSEVFVSDTVPQEGEVDFGSLPGGIYTLVETKAPSGYELPIGQWILTIDPNKEDSGADDWKIEFAGKSDSLMPPAAIREEGAPVPTYRIINARPFTIGMSGLAGTSGMLLLGFIFMAIAGNAYIAHGYKQRNRGNQTDQSNQKE